MIVKIGGNRYPTSPTDDEVALHQGCKALEEISGPFDTRDSYQAQQAIAFQEALLQDTTNLKAHSNPTLSVASLRLGNTPQPQNHPTLPDEDPTLLTTGPLQSKMEIDGVQLDVLSLIQIGAAGFEPPNYHQVYKELGFY